MVINILVKLTSVSSQALVHKTCIFCHMFYSVVINTNSLYHKLNAAE